MIRTALIRFAAILFGILLFWGIAEVGCRLVFNQVISYDVEMWRYARQVKTTGLTEGLRFEHRPNVEARLMGVDVRINNDGLRDRVVDRNKAQDTYRIAVVGDSITFGWGVSQQKTYPKQLETVLNVQQALGPDVTFEVINFGVGNYTISDVVAMLKYKALDYTPDLVIYGAFLNDAERQTPIGSGSFLLQNSLSAVWIWGRLDTLWRQFGTRQSYEEYYLDLYREEGAGSSRVLDGIAEMRELCRSRSIPLLVTMLPELHDGSAQRFENIHLAYLDAAIANGAMFVDLQPVLPENNLRRFWVSPDDAHPNADAFTLYAARIAEEVASMNLSEEESR